eukprot:7560410-Pyramimonas_sp.AAC.1
MGRVSIPPQCQTKNSHNNYHEEHGAHWPGRRSPRRDSRTTCGGTDNCMPNWRPTSAPGLEAPLPPRGTGVRLLSAWQPDDA